MKKTNWLWREMFTGRHTGGTLFCRLFRVACSFAVFLSAIILVAGCSTPTPPVAPTPYGAKPTPRQLEWHKLRYYAFIHFGPNTFTDVEWGHGDENPVVFNPSQLDARQWARVIRDAGMEGVIITAKHHDGFALWPSAFSTHTVRESAWKDGHGDVLRELSDACREFGLKFGIYISPWDRNHPAYGTDEYNDVFKSMLKEVLTQYGDVFEVWFDGANGEGPNGKKQVYDFEGFAEVVRAYQPGAVIFSDGGPDIRWIGNEDGYAAETNWSTIRAGSFYPGIGGVNDQLQHGHEDGDTWLPAEVNTSIRPGWFYHRDQDDQVKPLSRLVDNWYHSVGMNGNFLLNLPVDSRGLVHENDAARLMELKAYIDAAFSLNFARAARVEASNTRQQAALFAAENAIDDDPSSYWATGDDVVDASIELFFPEATPVNAMMIQEYIALGQRVKSFEVEILRGGEYIPVASGTTVGNRRIVRFDTIDAEAIRVTIHGKASPVISNIEVYRVPEDSESI